MSDNPFDLPDKPYTESFRRLWAPWRLSYIRGDASDEPPLAPVSFLPDADRECFLCQGAGQPQAADNLADDRRRLVVQRRRHTLWMLNRYPYNNGHLLIAPRAHKATLEALTDEELLEISHTIRDATGLLQLMMAPAGFNVGLTPARWSCFRAICLGGAPWRGDANSLSVTADTRVISQSLDELWQMLSAALQGPT